MSKARKRARAFVIQNRHLGLDRLAEETGLSPRQIGRLLAEIGQRRSTEAEPPPAPGSDRPTWAAAGFVATVTALVYLPALSGQFVNWDDPIVILENLNIRRLDGESLGWMVTTFHTGNWIPLTWLSHALDYRLWGLVPWGHHLTSVLLHAVNAALVFLLSSRILARAAAIDPPETNASRRNLWIAALAALLFGVHPLHVESVAWVSERKDLLCGLFFLLSLLAYVGAEPGEAVKRRYPWVSLGLFALALLSKPMAVTLPLVLLLLDAWPLRRLRGNPRPALVEKVPFIALACVSALVTLRAQAAAGAIASDEVLPLAFRSRNALRSVAFYLGKMVVPVDLVPLYPIAPSAVPGVTPGQVGAALLVIGLTGGAVLAARRGRPAPLAAWSYYLVTLAPVLGIVQVGHQSAADRYAYLPSVSIFLLFAAALARIAPPVLFRAAALLLVAALCALCVGQIAVWRDSVTLWERVTSSSPGVSAVAHTNLANAFRKVGRTDEAIREYRRARAIPPPHAYIHDGLGAALLDGGDVEGAIAEFEKAISLDPRYAPAHRNLWFAYDRKGSGEEALAAIQEAVRLAPDFAAAWSNLGISYARVGRMGESEEALRRAVALDPDDPQYLANLGTTLGKLGKREEAVELYRRARRLDAREPVYAMNLANTYLELGRPDAARASYEEALALAPDLAPAHAGLARLLLAAGERARARDHAAKAVSLGAPLDAGLAEALSGR